MYKNSRYNIFTKLDNNEYIVFNTRTSAIAKITSKIFEKYFSLESAVLFEEISIPATLIANGFFVDNQLDEFSDIKERYLKNFYRRDILNLTILPAEFCNLTCPYCFIYNYGGEVISQALLDSALVFIESRIVDNFHLQINWYGGESLLALDKILYFMNKIAYFKNRTISLHSSITTNGVYLTKEVFNQLIKSGISTFQITFDGGEQYHDEMRKDFLGKGSFQTILSNLKDIRENANNQEYTFNIRINFTQKNFESVPPLIDVLLNIVGDDPRFNIYCRPVYHFDTKREASNTTIQYLYNPEEGLKMQYHLMNYIRSKKELSVSSIFNSLIPKSRCSWCFEDNAYSHLMGADGSIYKCDTLVGDKKYAIGKLESNGIIRPQHDNEDWLTPIFFKKEYSKCFSCNLLPICFGGCRRTHLQNNNFSCYLTEDFLKNQISAFYKEGLHYGK